MARSAPRSSSRWLHPDIRQAFGWSIPVAMVIMIIGIIVYQNWPHRSPKVVIPSGSILPTPAEYSDFISRISSINGSTLTLPFNIVNAQGESTLRKFQVTIAAATKIEKSVGRGENEHRESLTLEQLRVGNVIQVYADANLARATAFVPTKIVVLNEYTQ